VLVERATLLAWVLAGLAGMAAIAAAPSLDLIILVVLALAVLQAASAGSRPFATRLRGPVFAVVVLALAAASARGDGPPLLSRLGAGPVPLRTGGGGWAASGAPCALRDSPEPVAPLPLVAPVAARKASQRQTNQPARRRDARRLCAVCRLRRTRPAPARRDPGLLAARVGDRARPATVAGS